MHNKKRILTVYTGGTIGCAPSGGQRTLDTALSKRYIALRFSQSDSPYAGISSELFEDSCLESQTLSENMTFAKLQGIIDHLNTFDLSAYAGVMIMHGTDTLAYTAALLSMLFCDLTVPIMLVSSARPPMDEKTNAHANFRAGAELICSGIAPNIYVPYRNTDGRMRLHIGSRLMQCPNFSDDFTSAGESFFADTEQDIQYLIEKCSALSQKRTRSPVDKNIRLKNCVRAVFPYTGLDYDSIYLDGIFAVVHGTYHSGTLCVERNSPEADYSSASVLHLAKKCSRDNIPLFAAPCHLGEEQYSSVFDANRGGVMPLEMTFECAYAKAQLLASAGFSGNDFIRLMQTELNNEII